MYIMAVDDERRALNVLMRAVRQAAPDCILSGFTNPGDAAAHARENKVDIAFLDIRMGDMDGLTLAKKLKESVPKINIIFVTGHQDHAPEAFGLHASGYVGKPVSAKTIRKEMENLRFAPAHTGARDVRVQTFGNFDVFINEVPLVFRRSKAKEILAYLVDRRGATVSKKELANILWGEADYNRNMQKHLQILVAEMLRALKDAGASGIVRKQYNSLSVIPDNITCDYYRFLEGDQRSIETYYGEYMANYSWAETTAGSLTSQKNLYYTE